MLDLYVAEFYGYEELEAGGYIERIWFLIQEAYGKNRCAGLDNNFL